MAQTVFHGSLLQSGSVPTTALGSGVVSSSVQMTTLLPVGIFSSSAQLPSGTVSGSAQVDYNSITNKLSGVVSASAQVAPLLPAGTVSSSVAAVAGPAENLYLATNFGGFTPWL